VSVVSRGQGYEVDSSSSDCVIRRVVPQPTEWQRVRNQIDTAFVFARSDFVNVHGVTCKKQPQPNPLRPALRGSIPCTTLHL
jgi:hypothetical protein